MQYNPSGLFLFAQQIPSKFGSTAHITLTSEKGMNNSEKKRIFAKYIY